MFYSNHSSVEHPTIWMRCPRQLVWCLRTGTRPLSHAVAKYWCLPRHSAGMQTCFRALGFIYDFPSVAFPWGGITLIKSSGTRRPHRPLILYGSCQHSATHHYIFCYKQKWNVAVWEAWASHHNRIRLTICQPDTTMLHNAGRLRGHCCGRVMHNSAAHARLCLHCSTIQVENFALLTMILQMHAFVLPWGDEQVRRLLLINIILPTYDSLIIMWMTIVIQNDVLFKKFYTDGLKLYLDFFVRLINIHYIHSNRPTFVYMHFYTE